MSYGTRTIKIHRIEILHKSKSIIPRVLNKFRKHYIDFRISQVFVVKYSSYLLQIKAEWKAILLTNLSLNYLRIVSVQQRSNELAILAELLTYNIETVSQF